MFSPPAWLKLPITDRAAHQLLSRWVGFGLDLGGFSQIFSELVECPTLACNFAQPIWFVYRFHCVEFHPVELMEHYFKNSKNL